VGKRGGKPPPRPSSDPNRCRRCLKLGGEVYKLWRGGRREGVGKLAAVPAPAWVPPALSPSPFKFLADFPDEQEGYPEGEGGGHEEPRQLFAFLALGHDTFTYSGISLIRDEDRRGLEQALVKSSPP